MFIGLSSNKTILLSKLVSKDGTIKYIYQNKKGIIEISKLVNKDGIDVYCVPSHYYCVLGCTFCHLTVNNDGIKEMIPVAPDELIVVMNKIFSLNKEENKEKVLFSFMGVGEAVLNRKLISTVYNYYKEDKKVSLALATVMSNKESLEQLIKEVDINNLPLKITLSLHSPLDEKRQKIIPSSKLKVEECYQVLNQYRDTFKYKPILLNNLKEFHSSETPVLIHYTVIVTVNDSEQELETLISLGNKYKIPLKILKFNPTNDLNISLSERRWMNILKEKYIPGVVYYESPGNDIGSSCGQFNTNNYLEFDKNRK